MTDLEQHNSIQARWRALDGRLALLRKLFYDFYELYDAKAINGEKGKPGRPELQLQIKLYRQESVKIHNEFIALNLERLQLQRKASK